MSKPYIICVDDQREVLAALKKDLNFFASHFRIEECESTAEADEILNELDADGTHISLVVCDHIMPGETGIDFLARLSADNRFVAVKKMLLTGLATHEDTIRAINNASIDFYISKPWDSEALIHSIKILLTRFIVGSDLDFQDFIPILDQQTLYKELRNKN